MERANGSDREAAPTIFTGIAPQYSWMGAIWSFGQDGAWRRAMVEAVNVMPGALVLDVAAGTGLVSRELAARRRFRVVSLDPSEPMLRAGIPANEAAGLAGRIDPVLGRAEALPFADATFDAVTFTYLLRYVDDPEATLGELARVLRPGGIMASLEFHLPDDARPARRVAGLHAHAHAGGRPDGLALLVRDRQVPGAEHRALLSPRAAAGAGALVAGGRAPPRPDAGDVPGLRRRRSGR